MNDILVDGLRELAQKEGVTQDQNAAALPIFAENDQLETNVTEMPRPKGKP
jgi:hypothetical protein